MARVKDQVDGLDFQTLREMTREDLLYIIRFERPALKNRFLSVRQALDDFGQALVDAREEGDMLGVDWLENARDDISDIPLAFKEVIEYEVAEAETLVDRLSRDENVDESQIRRLNQEISALKRIGDEFLEKHARDALSEESAASQSPDPKLFILLHYLELEEELGRLPTPAELEDKCRNVPVQNRSPSACVAIIKRLKLPLLDGRIRDRIDNHLCYQRDQEKEEWGLDDFGGSIREAIQSLRIESAEASRLRQSLPEAPFDRLI
jgi:hypothetical protein